MSALFPGLIDDEPAQGSDVAYTPEAVVSAILDPAADWAIRLPEADRVWEPCAGGGAWIRALRAYRHTLAIAATEIDPSARSVVDRLARRGDARDPAACPWSGKGEKPYEIWTNPPFSLANDLCKAWFSFPNAPRRIVLLVLQSWPNAAERAWLRPYLRRQVVLYPRICFGGPGRPAGQTDQRDYALIELTPGRPRTRGESWSAWHYDWRARVVS
jgi:hypothetical protein